MPLFVPVSHPLSFHRMSSDFIYFFLLFKPKLRLSLANVFGNFGLHDFSILKSI